MTVEATIGPRQAAARAWDAVVVGAGPAGAVLARQLGGRGRRVLLVDRQAFPRDKVCGGCLSARTLHRLDALELGSVVTRLHAVPLRRLRLRGRRHAVDLPLPGGASLSRFSFDAALVEEAIRAGSDFLPGCRASLLPIVGGRRGVALRTPEGVFQANTSVAVLAGGLGCSIPGARRKGRRPTAARIGAGQIVAAAPASYRRGTVHMAVGRGGYVGVVRLEDDRVNVAAALDPALVRRQGVGSLATRLLTGAGFSSIDGLREADWAGTERLGFRPRRLADERVFVIGDAAGYVEPFTGEGIGWAIDSAALLEPLVARAVDVWSADLASEWAGLYRRRVRRAQRACRLVSGLLRRPWGSQLALAAVVARPALCRPLVHHLHGGSCRVQGAEEWL